MLKALTVEPGFAAVDVAYVEEVFVGFVFGGTVAGGYEYVVGGIDGDGDGVVEQCRGGVGMPVDGIDADVGTGDDGFDVAHVFHGVVADGDACVALTLCGTDMTAFFHVVAGHFVSEDVSCCHLVVGGVADMMEQFDCSQASLTESCNDERAALVAVALEVVEGFAYVSHRETCAPHDGVGVHCHPCIEGGVAVVGGKETVAGCHVGCYFVDFPCHVATMIGIPYVGIVAGATETVGPIFFPRGNDVEDVGSCTCSIEVAGYPHSGVAIVGRQWDEGVGEG